MATNVPWKYNNHVSVKNWIYVPFLLPNVNPEDVIADSEDIIEDLEDVIADLEDVIVDSKDVIVEPENAIADSEDAIAKLADSDWENGRMGEWEKGRLIETKIPATRKGETGRSKRSGDSAQRKWDIKRLRSFETHKPFRI